MENMEKEVVSLKTEVRIKMNIIGYVSGAALVGIIALLVVVAQHGLV
jgi:hypothetical protein